MTLNNANNQNSSTFYITSAPATGTAWGFGGTLNPYIWVRHGNTLAPNSKDGVISFDSHPYTFVNPDGATVLPTGFSSGSESTPSGWGIGTLYRVHNSNTVVGEVSMYWRSNGEDGGSGIRIYTNGPNNSTYSVAIQKNTCALPVIFDKLSATFTNEKLVIRWSTLQETNNSHFDVMASVNGASFKKIGTIDSKSPNGNSDMVLNYSYNIDAAQAFALMGIPFTLSLLILGFARNNKKLSAGLFLVISLLFFYSCQKNDIKTSISTGSTVYLKIVQVDKDGSFKESKTIKAIKKY